MEEEVDYISDREPTDAVCFEDAKVVTQSWPICHRRICHSTSVFRSVAYFTDKT